MVVVSAASGLKDKFFVIFRCVFSADFCFDYFCHLFNVSLNKIE